MIDLARDRAICEAAPAGTWIHILDPSGWFVSVESRTIKICDCYMDANVGAFISAARTGWPLALDEIERLTAQLRLQPVGGGDYSDELSRALARVAELEAIEKGDDEDLADYRIALAQRDERIRELEARAGRMELDATLTAEALSTALARVAELESFSWAQAGATKLELMKERDEALARVAELEAERDALRSLVHLALSYASDGRVPPDGTIKRFGDALIRGAALGEGGAR